MEQELTLVRIGHSARLERLLPQALAGLRVKGFRRRESNRRRAAACFLPPRWMNTARMRRFAACCGRFGSIRTVCPAAMAA
ncbi:MAG: hypothetical protein ACLR8L_14295 [Oscillospiraceae bacterium]